MKTKVGSLVLFFFLSFLANATVQDSVHRAALAIVAYKSDTVFYIYSSLGSYNPRERAATIEQRLAALVEQPGFTPDSLYINQGDRNVEIFFKDQVILSVTPGDAKPLGKTQLILAREVLSRLQYVIETDSKSRSLFNILLKVGLTLLELLILYLLIRYLNKLFNYTRKLLITTREKILQGVRFRGYELLDTHRELRVALFINTMFRWAVIILVLYLAIPILFSIFPWTRGLSDKLFGYILAPIRKISLAVINYIPNLFTIAVVYLATRYTVRFLKFLSHEIEREALKIPGFYPDWAMPTYNIVKILSYAFMFIVIFPYLPGSDSPVFQGVSVFLGVLFSFGSSSAISNVVAGLVITYMRPFKVGDRIKIGEVCGDVVEKTLLVTRIRTVKNEDITMPNASVLSGYTVNYSTPAIGADLILHTTITIGYDVPWKRVHQLLVAAAMATDGIIKSEDKRPFVLQSSLDDSYVSYQINVYTMEPSRMNGIYSDLHAHIQDQFNAAGVEILSPSYRAERDGNKTTIPGTYREPQ